MKTRKKFHEYPAFSELSACKEAIEMYQGGNTMQQVADHYRVPMTAMRSLLDFYSIERRGIRGIPEKIAPVIRPKGKYDHLIFEPVNQGHDYAELLEKSGQKVYKGTISLKKKPPLD